MQDNTTLRLLGELLGLGHSLLLGLLLSTPPCGSEGRL